MVGVCGCGGSVWVGWECVGECGGSVWMSVVGVCGCGVSVVGGV